MASTTADALRRLVRSARTLPPSSANADRIMGVVESRRAAGISTFSSSWEGRDTDVVNASRPPAPLVIPPDIYTDDTGMDVHDPLFDAYYDGADSSEQPFGASWTSRYGMSPPPPISFPGADPSAATSPYGYRSSLFDDMVAHPSTGANSAPIRPTSSSLQERFANFRSNVRSTISASRVSDFESYTSRRRSNARSSHLDLHEQRQPRGAADRESAPDLWVDDERPPPLHSGSGGGIFRGEAATVTDHRTSIDAEMSREVYIGSRTPPRRPSYLPPTSSYVPPFRGSGVGAGPSLGTRRYDPPYDTTLGGASTSFDDLRQRLESYPRHGHMQHAGPQSVSLRPPHSALLLTQGRLAPFPYSHETRRSRSPPLTLESVRNDSLSALATLNTLVHNRTLRRTNLRAPETLASNLNADTASSTTRALRLPLRRHGSMPSPQPGLTGPGGNFLLYPSGGGGEALFRSPSPMPEGVLSTGATTYAGGGVGGNNVVEGTSANAGGRSTETDEQPPPPTIQSPRPEIA